MNLLKELNFYDDDDSDSNEDKEKNRIKRIKAVFIFLLCQAPFVKFLLDKKKNNKNYEIDEENHEKISNDEEAQQEITDCNNLCRVLQGEDIEKESSNYNNYKLNNSIQVTSNKNYYSSMNNINEFYSKIGNRLGNMN